MENLAATGFNPYQRPLVANKDTAEQNPLVSDSTNHSESAELVANVPKIEFKPFVLTNNNLVIGTKDGALPDYTRILALNSQFQCLCVGWTSTPHCMVIETGLAFALPNGKGQFPLGGGVFTIKSNEFTLIAKFEKGQPVGKVRLTIDDGITLHNYLAEMTIKDGQCHIICSKQLLDGSIILTKNGLVNRVKGRDGRDKDSLVNIRGTYRADDGALIEGKWRKGKPDGPMTFEKVMSAETVSYKGGMTIAGSEVVFDGAGRKVVDMANEIHIFDKATWNKGLLTSADVKVLFFKAADNASNADDLLQQKKNGSITFGKFDYAKRKTISIKNYEGEIINNEAHGEGVMTWVNKTKYEGSFEHDVPSGYGKVSHADGQVQIGQFIESDLCGWGTTTWPNGNEYEGGHAKCALEGWGTYRFASGDYFTGGYRAGKRHGWGIYYFNDGKTLRAIWDNNKVTEGTYTVPGEYEYKGPVSEQGLPHGMGIRRQWMENGQFSGDTEQTTHWIHGVLQTNDDTPTNALTPIPKYTEAPYSRVRNVGQRSQQLAANVPHSPEADSIRPQTAATQAPPAEPQKDAEQGAYIDVSKEAPSLNGYCEVPLPSRNMTCKGTWVNGVPQGKMMLQCEGGEYVGTLDKDLLFHGKGKLKVIQQKSFIVRGHWIHGVLSKDPVRMTTLTVNESGEHVFTHYRGQLNPDYQEHGQGERTNKKDGSKIRGQWKNGSFIGHNTYSI